VANAGVIQPWFGGTRTVEEQMQGIAPALAEARGKSVLDLGCAEGAIALRFVTSGAARVVGVECNEASVTQARQYCGVNVRIEHGNLNTMTLPAGPWDIVLALAIIHKLRQPAKLISDISETHAPLVVVRLPDGSTGRFLTKHYATPCDLNAEFIRHGYTMGSQVPGPRNELVQYWRRGC